jgi:hypothetical protein
VAGLHPFIQISWIQRVDNLKHETADFIRIEFTVGQA